MAVIQTGFSQTGKPGIVREFGKPGKVWEFEIWSGQFFMTLYFSRLADR